MAIPSSFPRTFDPLIDAATHGFVWQTGASRTINWSVAHGYNGEFWFDPQGLAGTLQGVFSNISSYANVRFSYRGIYSDPGTAAFFGSEITVSLSGAALFGANTSTWAVGFYPSAGNGITAGDIFLNINSLANFLPSYTPGSAGYALMIHEIGHTLGLKHPFDRDGGRPTLKDFGLEELDQDWFTVMAYNDNFDFNLISWDPATPMIMDVLALQYLYGKNNSTNASNTTHTLATTSQYRTIWDAAGTDAVDVSASPVGWDIQLPRYRLSSLVDTKAGWAAPAGEMALPSPFTWYWLAGDIENANGSAFADQITGSGLRNTLNGGGGDDFLEGGGGDDRLDGGAGNDLMFGGAGNDTYIVDSAADVLVESAGRGTDVQRTALGSATLAANVEQLVYTGSGSFVGNGNALANRLTGGPGNDFLDGGAGADTLVGSGGNDIYIVDHASDAVVENARAGEHAIVTARASLNLNALRPGTKLALYTGVEILVYAGAGDFNAVGNGLDNLLIGGAGNDRLNGGKGEDLLAGGLGNDVYTVDNAGDVISEDLGSGSDTVRSSRSYALGENLENLVLTGSANASGTGNALNNGITGNTGNNLLDGLGGNDTLAGGGGNDTYMIDSGLDQVLELARGGTDIERTALASRTLAANVEQLVYTGASNFSGIGNSLANRITGGAGHDRLDGRDGADTLVGGAGNDTFVVDNAGDRVIEGAGDGIDTIETARASLSLNAVRPGTAVPLYGEVENVVYAGIGNFTVTGNALDNVLTGGAGSDRLNGGAGSDVLNGGAGSDAFTLNVKASGFDTITDFAPGVDALRIDNTLLKLGAVAAGAFNAGGFSAAQEADDRLIYNTATGALYYDADGLGAIDPVQIAVLSGAPGLLAVDLLLV